MALKFERFCRKIQVQRREIIPGPTLGFPFSMSTPRYATYLRRAQSLLLLARGETVELHRCRCHQDCVTLRTAQLLQPGQGEAVVVVGHPSRLLYGQCVTRVTHLRAASEPSCLCNLCAR